MRVAIIGAVFAHLGHTVTCLEVDGRNYLDRMVIEPYGLEYVGIGR